MYVICDGGDYDGFAPNYWNNIEGWGNLEYADVYLHTDYDLPMTKYGPGFWVKLPKCLKI
jgi:hypothetical protein